ncbi:hypothetical protein SRS16CHR_03570 [Variovorax sp. SRS16]|nr:hypothetical protein SRS16CHR_03570 [Variovorax sp. SRS16]
MKLTLSCQFEGVLLAQKYPHHVKRFAWGLGMFRNAFPRRHEQSKFAFDGNQSWILGKVVVGEWFITTDGGTFDSKFDFDRFFIGDNCGLLDRIKPYLKYFALWAGHTYLSPRYSTLLCAFVIHQCRNDA